MDTPGTGGCLCGQVRYRQAAEPVVARICRCSDGQHIERRPAPPQATAAHAGGGSSGP